jgi:hypothetical protein
MDHPLSAILYGLGALLFAGLAVAALRGMRAFWRIGAAQGCASLFVLASAFLFLAALMVLLMLAALGHAPAGF